MQEQFHLVRCYLLLESHLTALWQVGLSSWAAVMCLIY